MRNLQELFNVLIEQGYYKEKDNSNSSSFMCISLTCAYKDKLITIEEYNKAKCSIDRYMEKLNTKYITLNGALLFNNFMKTPMQVYKDWKNRPRKR